MEKAYRIKGSKISPLNSSKEVVESSSIQNWSTSLYTMRC